MQKYLWSVVLVALTVAVSIGVATASAGGGNSANAKLCNQGKWMNVQGSDGTQFGNEQECVSYAAKGGALISVPASVSVSYTPTPDPRFVNGECDVTIILSHFDPNASYTVAVSEIAEGELFPDYPGLFTVNTDSTGAGSVFTVSLPASYEASPRSINASVGTVSSGYQTIAC